MMMMISGKQFLKKTAEDQALKERLARKETEQCTAGS